MQLAFLSTMVSPKVASAAAQRALEALASEDISTADLEDYLPMEEPINGKLEAAAPEPAEPVAAAAAEEGATPEPPAALEPASHAAPAQAVAKADGAENANRVKDEPMHEHDEAGDASAAARSNGAPAHPFTPCENLLCRFTILEPL